MTDVTTTPGNGELPIDAYLCLALYQASRAVTGLYRQLLAGLGLTYPQYLVMRLLWQRGPLPVKDIATALQLHYGTLSPLLKRLQVAGLINRNRRSDGERSVEIVLTDVGTALHDQATDVPTELSCATGLSDEDMATLRQSLAHLTASVTQATPSTD